MTRTDQAGQLRRLREQGIASISPRRPRAIAVTGGKGGIGKSAIAVNLAVSYAGLGARTLLVDGDLGMADLNLLLGVAPERSALDVLQGMPVGEALVEVHGLHLLPALNGSFQLENMDAEARARLLDAIDGLATRFDTLVVDIGAGIGRNQVEMTGASPTVVVVATPEPLALADAYACIKVLSRKHQRRRAYILPNRVRNQDEADEVVSRLNSLVHRFLDFTLTPLPAIPYDTMVSEAAAEGLPVVLSRPDSPASRAIRLAARRLDVLAADEEQPIEGRFFHRRQITGDLS
ncbi:MAG TPA: P-loop NTPase [Kofleriaceae bacterium]|nr:P-loop NTPase [Kofleriaceae bacterium]